MNYVDDWGLLLFGLKMLAVAHAFISIVHTLQQLIIKSIFMLFCTKNDIITMAIILDNSVFKV
jgi:hypothetical protein